MKSRIPSHQGSDGHLTSSFTLSSVKGPKPTLHRVPTLPTRTSGFTMSEGSRPIEKEGKSKLVVYEGLVLHLTEVVPIFRLIRNQEFFGS